jgi:hypothetical protein
MLPDSNYLILAASVIDLTAAIVTYTASQKATAHCALFLKNL